MKPFVTIDELILLRARSNNLGLSARKKIFSSLAGNYVSHFRGRGMDYRETRIYQPGDDIRHMDWRVTARTGRPHTKLFTEERERPVFVVVDHGPAMCFGTQVTFKASVAAQLAAALAWSVSGGGDRIGGVVLSEQGCRELRPQSGRRGVLRLLQTIVDAQGTQPVKNAAHLMKEPEAATLEVAMSRLKCVAHPGSLIFVLSDFHTLDDAALNQVSLLARHSEMIWVFIYDPLEAEPPPPGHYTISNGREVSVFDSANPVFRRAYRERFKQRLEKLVATCRKFGIHFLSVATNEDVVKALHAGLLSPAKGTGNATVQQRSSYIK
jgi:uncharacterized protein (DUF58 family)